MTPMTHEQIKEEIRERRINALIHIALLASIVATIIGLVALTYTI